MPLTLDQLTKEINTVARKTGLFAWIRRCFKHNPHARVIIGGACIVNRNPKRKRIEVGG